MSLPEVDLDTRQRAQKVDKRVKYDFSKISPPCSIWVATADERLAMFRAFKRLKDKTGSPYTVQTQEVGDDDKKGAGYRLYFSVEPHDKVFKGRSAVQPFLLTAQVPAIYSRMRDHGIIDEETYIAAIISTGVDIKTVNAWVKVRDMLMKGDTPWQQLRGF